MLPSGQGAALGSLVLVLKILGEVMLVAINLNSRWAATLAMLFVI